MTSLLSVTALVFAAATFQPAAAETSPSTLLLDFADVGVTNGVPGASRAFLSLELCDLGLHGFDGVELSTAAQVLDQRGLPGLFRADFVQEATLVHVFQDSDAEYHTLSRSEWSAQYGSPQPGVPFAAAGVLTTGLDLPTLLQDTRARDAPNGQSFTAVQVVTTATYQSLGQAGFGPQSQAAGATSDTVQSLLVLDCDVLGGGAMATLAALLGDAATGVLDGVAWDGVGLDCMSSTTASGPFSALTLAPDYVVFVAHTGDGCVLDGAEGTACVDAADAALGLVLAGGLCSAPDDCGGDAVCDAVMDALLLGAGAVADAWETVDPAQYVWVPFDGGHEKGTSAGPVGTAAGRWSVGLVPESAAAGTGLTSGGIGPSGQVYAVVGDVTIDAYDQGEITQDTAVIAGDVVIVAEDPPSISPEAYAALAVTCTGGAVALMRAAPAAAANAPWGWVGWGVGALVVAACFAFLYIHDPVGTIECGISPWSVEWGGEAADSDLEDTASMPPVVELQADSSSDAKSRVYYDENGQPAGPGYIPVYNGEGHKRGKDACQSANRASKSAAEAAAQNYGTVQGDGDAAIALTVDLTTLVDTMGTFEQLQGSFFWSPVHGFAVGCAAGTGCPLRLRIEVTQCGFMEVKGGSPSEVTYSFEGDPTACPATVSLSATPDSTLHGVTVPGLVLSVFYDGAGDDSLVGSLDPSPPWLGTLT